MEVSAAIFRSYDVRGVYPTDLNEEVAEHFGKALGTYFVNKNLNSFVVGRDNRESSPTLSKSLIKGLLSTGCNVTDTGVSITPAIHYLTCVKNFDGGICVTASHNPREYNGFRLDYSHAVSLYGEELQEVYALVKSEKYAKGSGKYEKIDLFHLYTDFIKKRFSFDGVKVVIDCGNGTSSFFVKELFEDLGCQVSDLYCSSDPSFPHGVPDPERKSFMEGLGKVVVDQGADIGFAFDNDMDRFGVVDEKGNLYETDKMLLLFSEDLLSHTKGATVVYDVKSTGLLDKYISKAGGVPKMLRTGHPYIAEAISKGALLGAEFSGHVFFGGEYFGYDDGIYAACKVLEVLKRRAESLSSLMNNFPKLFHTSEIKIPCTDETKFTIVEDIVRNLIHSKDVRSVSNVDGVRVQVNDTGWFLIRASNTTPVLSVRVEGKDEYEVKSLLDMVRLILESYKEVDLSLFDSSKIYCS